MDSEHSAVLQCVAGRDAELGRLILTCSGGPFREWPLERIRGATVEEALRHPTWRMGQKITVDSATLANKALEVIEAHYLFGLPYDALDVVVHPQSIIHAFVEFCDGSVIAQLGFPSMELPILYALTHPGAAARYRGPALRSGGRRAADLRAGAAGCVPGARRRAWRRAGRGHRAGGVQRRERNGGRGVPGGGDTVRADQRDHRAGAGRARAGAATASKRCAGPTDGPAPRARSS